MGDTPSSADIIYTIDFIILFFASNPVVNACTVFGSLRSWYVCTHANGKYLSCGFGTDYCAFTSRTFGWIPHNAHDVFLTGSNGIGIPVSGHHKYYFGRCYQFFSGVPITVVGGLRRNSVKTRLGRNGRGFSRSYGACLVVFLLTDPVDTYCPFRHDEFLRYGRYGSAVSRGKAV